MPAASDALVTEIESDLKDWASIKKWKTHRNTLTRSPALPGGIIALNATTGAIKKPPLTTTTAQETTISDAMAFLFERQVSLAIMDDLVLVSVQIVGSGNTNLEPGVNYPIKVTTGYTALRAYPKPGWVFNGWTGGGGDIDDAAAAHTTITPTASRAIVATFVESP